MYRAPHEAINVRDAGIGNDQFPPQSAPNQASRGMSSFDDGSGPIFSMYSEMAAEEDKKMVESWQADAEGILIFTGLFSAAVASLISISIQDIRPNSQDTSNFYLANIYQTIADPNISLPSSPAPFSPPSYAVWVNTLWFLSLVISITCALLATLLQRWARRYIKITQPRYNPHKRARIRTFFFEGVEKSLLPWVVEALPTLLHVSLFLFFSGLVIFLWNVNLTTFKLVLSWVGISTALYGCMSFVPIFRHDSPYYTPLTSLAWPIVIGMSYAIFEVLRWFTRSDSCHRGASRHFEELKNGYHKMLLQGMQKTLEESALKSPPDIDTRAFLWTFDRLDEDNELERFFSGLPGYRSSEVVGHLLFSLAEEQKRKLSAVLLGLADRTFSSGLLPEPVQNRRAIIYAKAIDPEYIPESMDINKLLSIYREGRPLAAEIVQIVRGWGNNNLSLAVLIHVTRQQLNHYDKPSWPAPDFFYVLEAASEFDVRDTSPELQHEFCALWNQIALKVQNNNNGRMVALTLRPIRHIYIALHQDTDSAPTQFSASTHFMDKILWEPSAYPMCNVAGHIHDDVSPTTIAHTDPHDSTTPILPSSSVPAPLHVVERLTDVPLPDDSNPANQTTTERPRIPATAGAIRDVVTSGITIPLHTPETSTPAPLSSTLPPLQRNVDLSTPSDSNIPSSDPVLDNILPTGPASARDPGAAAEVGGKPKPGLRKVALDPPR